MCLNTWLAVSTASSFGKSIENLLKDSAEASTARPWEKTARFGAPRGLHPFLGASFLHALSLHTHHYTFL